MEYLEGLLRFPNKCELSITEGAEKLTLIISYPEAFRLSQAFKKDFFDNINSTEEAMIEES